MINCLFKSTTIVNIDVCSLTMLGTCLRNSFVFEGCIACFVYSWKFSRMSKDYIRTFVFYLERLDIVTGWKRNNIMHVMSCFSWFLLVWFLFGEAILLMLSDTSSLRLWTLLLKRTKLPAGSAYLIFIFINRMKNVFNWM